MLPPEKFATPSPCFSPSLMLYFLQGIPPPCSSHPMHTPCRKSAIMSTLTTVPIVIPANLPVPTVPNSPLASVSQSSQASQSLSLQNSLSQHSKPQRPCLNDSTCPIVSKTHLNTGILNVAANNYRRWQNRHRRDGGRADVGSGPLRASVPHSCRQWTKVLRASVFHYFCLAFGITHILC